MKDTKSREIDAGIRQEIGHLQQQITLLFLGTGESGTVAHESMLILR
jgi:hypothetical protein